MNHSSANAKPGNRRSWSMVVATAVVYAALGAVGIAFAISPGYASPVFPAAGVAVAMLVRSAGLAWPGIWVGSFLLNVVVAHLNGNLGTGTVLLAAGIGVGATLQALAAWNWASRGSRGGCWAMESVSDVTRCLVLAGPVASVVSASNGVGLLHLVAGLPGSECAYAWWTWWSGDTLGVLVLLPISMALLFQRESPWRARMTTLVLPMLCALFVVGAASFVVARWERSELQARVRAQGESVAQLLRQRFIAHQEVLSSLRRLAEVTPDMNFRQFEYFTRITLRDNRDLFALSINPYVTAGQRADFERAMADRSAVEGFEIRQLDAQRRFLRASERDEYVPVGFIAPLEGNRPAIGYDINSEPVRHDAISRARASGEPAITAPIQLVQENQKRVGVLVLTPAFRRDDGSGPAAAPRELQGFAVGVIKVDEMVRIATQSAEVAGIVFRLDDPAAPGDRKLLYQSSPGAEYAAGNYTWSKDIAVADRTWRLEVAPTPEFFGRQQRWASLAVGMGGLTLAGLLQVLLLVTTGSTAIVQRQVREQTAELRAKSVDLEDRNEQLNALFAHSPDGFVAFAPDGRVKFVNPAFQAITGIDPWKIVGGTEEALDAELRQRAETPASFAGVLAYFGDRDGDSPSVTLRLRSPRTAVLKLAGIDSKSPGIPRFLYLRDVTHEEEVNRMKSEFLSHAAHELRTPMTSILGYSELLLTIDTDEAMRRELTEIIHRQTLWLVDIINELLDLSRIEARRGKDLKIERFDVAALARDTITELAIDPARWPLALDAPGTGCHAVADRAKVHQALVNVLGNARKYSPDGGPIRVSVAEAGGRVGVTVRDSGIGMTAEQLARLGERFWRADKSGNTPGTGLGIAIVKEILALLGGSIDVESQSGAGTTVTLWLPTEEPGPLSAGAVTPP